MKIYKNPDRAEWRQLTQRAVAVDNSVVEERVAQILARVRRDGDRALRELAQEIDGVQTEVLRVSEQEIDEAAAVVSDDVCRAIAVAASNICRFHAAQRPAAVDVTTAQGVRCIQRAVPIRRVGLYIPAGTAPLFSTVLMLAMPAKVAGCSEVVLCSPTNSEGRIAAEVLYAARVCGVDEIYKVGGAQAIGAMAYGTESISAVDKIFGPGNRYVTAAKQNVAQRAVAIDMPAGPSEVMVLADASADAEFVAADLLSQAEHGADSQAMLVCTSEEFAYAVEEAVERQAAQLSRGKFIASSLSQSRMVVLAERADMLDFANLYAPEHLILALDDAWQAAEQVTAAGSVFVGNYSPESAGDYASGTNHTLPTSGWARAYSGVNFDSFVRKITYQELSPAGLAMLAPTIDAMATAEGLDAHAAAVKVRLSKL